MIERRAFPTSSVIERTSLRALFAALLGRALDGTRLTPSPMAVAYLIELLCQRVRTPEPGAARVPTLAEGLLSARLTRGGQRIHLLRELGDHALFVSGFFGESLTRSLVDLGYYIDVGRFAYADVSEKLESALVQEGWPLLFEELADCFGDFADLLGEVSERAGTSPPPDLLRLYQRYLETGGERDRLRLLARGQVPPRRQGRDVPQ